MGILWELVYVTVQHSLTREALLSPYWDGRSSSDEMSLKRCNKNHNYGQQGGE